MAETAGGGEILSLCSGDGRDLLPELAVAAGTFPAMLVENDEVLAAAAKARASALGLHDVTVMVGDAGEVQTFAARLPVDLLLLCGVFGNISTGDVQVTVAAAPGMLKPGGTLIWTRGAGRDTNLRPVIRALFEECGLEEVAFDSEPGGYGVGVNRLGAGKAAWNKDNLPATLFRFVQGRH